PAKSYPSNELLGDVFCDQLGISFRSSNFLNVQCHFTGNELFKLFFKYLNFSPFLANNYSWSGCEKLYPHLLTCPFHLYLGQSSMLETFLEKLFNFLIFNQISGIFLISIPD